MNSSENNYLEMFNQLCFEVFYQNEKGKQLLGLLEAKFFRSPVAFPDKEPSWAYFNEGQREMIRSFSNGIYQHMNKPVKTDEVKELKRTNKGQL